jgi:hypothetical protein
MKTAEEAMAFFRSRGHPAGRTAAYGSGGIFVAARSVLAEGDSTPLLQFAFVLCSEEQTWILRDFSGAIHGRFDSLADAVNTLLARLQEWLASHPE